MVISALSLDWPSSASYKSRVEDTDSSDKSRK